MPRGLVVLLILAACDGASSPGSQDAGVGAQDGSGAPDHEPPHVIAVAPAPDGDAWLHEQIRFTFDERIVAPALDVTATLGGTAISATAAIAPDERSIVVDLDPAIRGIGALELAVDGEVVDAAGNALAEPMAAAFTIVPWSARTVDRGPAAASPAIAVAHGGNAIAAWIVGAAGAHRAVVARATGEALGGELGSADVTAVELALDADDRPVLAYLAGGQAIVVGWEGSAWIPLLAAGAATHIALGANGDDPVLAVAHDGVITVRTLAGGAWQTIGADVPAGAIAELVVAGNAVGWVDASGGHVARFAGAWTALAPVPGALHLSLAVHDQVIAIAWDALSGSLGVYAAIATGTTWSRLGGVLDVDPGGDAQRPAIALAADGAPILAWQERIEGVERGITAMWTGGAWKILGGHSWLAGSAAPSGARIALGGAAPVVAYTAGGALGLARFNGPHDAALGRETRAPIAGCSVSAASPPATALASGCFTLVGPGKVAPHLGLVPYDIISELWTDGAKKRRWIALPDGAGMTVSATGAWEAPSGTVIIKEFALETTPGNPATRRAVETRFLVRDASGWQGFSYRWRADGSDADLLTDGQATQAWPLDTGGTYTHYYPSRSQCASCHEASFGPLLGLRPEQLQRWYDYDGVIAEQLPTLVQLGVGPTSTIAPLPSPHDDSQTVERRTRGYMAANCAHCHNPNHIAIKDLRITTPLAQTRLCETIVPGAPANSRVYQLVTERPGMPALGSLVPDPLIGSLVGSWIAGMTSCP
jgi:hypothetical protein